MNGENIYAAWRDHVDPAAPMWCDLGFDEREQWERVDEACAITRDMDAVTEIRAKLETIRDDAESALFELQTLDRVD